MRGGKRPGAGRPAGSATKKTSTVARAAAARGITPVEVMLEIMLAARAAGDFPMALDAAARVAPYTSPRLSAVSINLEDLSDAQLQDLAA
jgi:hypothetical protein